MPFVPHTAPEVAELLAAIGVTHTAELFDELPALPQPDLGAVAPGLPEWEFARLAQARAGRSPGALCFLGAGAYEHHIPAAVWQLLSRGEFYSAYTPYQAEASQGTLQLLYEFQTMIAGLCALPVAGASLYDGASALAEAALMALRVRPQAPRRVLVARTVHPRYRSVLRSLLGLQGIAVHELPFDPASGATDPAALAAAPEAAAVLIPQPNFFGVLEPVHALTDAGHARGMQVIGVVNPTALALLAPPGQWGAAGAEIACGEGQPLGIPLAGGGPYLGFLACRAELVRQLPGRLVGCTVDRDGRRGFVLTLQAREQHIRRAKATSNICTNQGLLATAATLYLALMGPAGLESVARLSAAALCQLSSALTAVPGVVPAFTGAVFHEQVLRLPGPAASVLEGLRRRGVLGGYALGTDYPEFTDALLVCATEQRSRADIACYGAALRAELAA